MGQTANIDHPEDDGEFLVITDNVNDLSRGCASPRTFYFECVHCERPVKVILGCGKRFDNVCPACARKWRNKTFKKYYRSVVTFKNPKFLTLTLQKKTDSGTMQQRLMKLWEMKKYLFKQLKRRGYPIRRWVGVIEPPNHMHIVIDSDYIPKAEISEIWNTITGDSFIVDIEQVNPMKDPKKVAVYLVKYIGKASSWVGLNLDLLKGFHLIGSWKLEPAKNNVIAMLCVCNCSFRRVGIDKPDLRRLFYEDYRAIIAGMHEVSAEALSERFGIRVNLS